MRIVTAAQMRDLDRQDIEKFHVSSLFLMESAVAEARSIHTCMTEAADVGRWLPRRINGPDVNKATFGHVLVIAGSQDFSGAPVLVAEAAARSGAGLVSLIVPEGIQQAVRSHVSPVVMTRSLVQSNGGTLSPAGLKAALTLAKKASVVAIGPGLGRGREITSFVHDFIMQCNVPMVIDADALNALAELPDLGASLIKGRVADTILTPHPGEMGRVLGMGTDAVQADRRGVVLKAAQTFGCMVLLKGARTLIAASDGTLYLNTTGSPGMATGGSGDALTGIVAALLSQRLEPLKAAAAGAYLHGLAGEIVEDGFGGSTGIIATDLIAVLPKAIAHCQSVALKFITS